MRRKQLKRSVCFVWVVLCGFVSSGASPEGSIDRIPLKAAKGEESGFRRLPSERTGIGMTNRLEGELFYRHLVLHNGSGVAAGDVNNDGRCDLYFCNLQGANRLYLNQGEWRFREVAGEAGVACAGQYSTGASFADVDGDGDLDLLVNSTDRGSRLFFNRGEGSFREASDSGLKKDFGPTSMAFADIEGDGDLDLYVTNYRRRLYEDLPEELELTLRREGGKMKVVRVNGESVEKPRWRGRFGVQPNGKIVEHGRPDFLYVNDGSGHFKRESLSGGRFFTEEGEQAPDYYDWGLAAMFRDLNGDRAPDLYVCNDNNSPDRIWINDGNGRFHAIQKLAIRHTSRSSMGLDIADINRDGYPDIFTLDMLARDHVKRHTQVERDLPRPGRIGQFRNRLRLPRNVLLLNRGDTTFAETAHYSGLAASDWSWCPIFLDVDLDGYEDLLISNGFSLDVLDSDHQAVLEKRKRRKNLTKRERQELRRLLPSFETSNLAFRNNGDLRFKEVSEEWGFARNGISYGMALADLDRDGDMDLAVNNLNHEAGIYENRADAPRVAVSLRGQPPNTEGIGAKIEVTGGPVPQSQEIMAGGRYLSDDQSRRSFAAGSVTNRLGIRVEWRSGKITEVDQAMPSHYYRIHESSALKAESPSSTRASDGQAIEGEGAPGGGTRPYFKDVSDWIGHGHEEEPFDDSARQPSLPRRLSQLGPGVAWYDLNADGRAELIVGSGKGGNLKVYENSPDAGFRLRRGAPWSEAVSRDQTTPLGWRGANGEAAVLVGSSNYEDGVPFGAPVRKYPVGGDRVRGVGSGRQSSSGPLAMADIDQDGDLDLFVGGRVVPKAYPEPASSLILRNEGSRFRIDRTNTQLVDDIGMVSGAVWSDIDGDSDPDLVLACEWGSLRLFINEEGKLTDETSPYQLAPHQGWWNGVATGDFNEDGRPDIIASNWGWNTVHEGFRSKPLRLYYGDVDQDGVTEGLEGRFDPDRKAWVPYRDRMGAARVLSSIRKRFVTHRAYAQADIGKVLGGFRARMDVLEANTLATSLFLNRGDHFTRHPLPIEAQLAPAFAVCVTDFDADGHEDVFLSQNFFATPPVTGRYDSGRGLWLRGNGQGELEPIPGHVSGVKVYGEQRGAAVADFDLDGRVDLVVTQNGAKTRLFKNRTERRGLRVRLEGSPGNPHAIGAQLRLISAEGKKGPLREVQAGSGYWSQNSPVQVLGNMARRKSLWVRWPDGKAARVALESDAWAITVERNGNADQRLE